MLYEVSHEGGVHILCIFYDLLLTLTVIQIERNKKKDRKKDFLHLTVLFVDKINPACIECQKTCSEDCILLYCASVCIIELLSGRRSLAIFTTIQLSISSAEHQMSLVLELPHPHFHPYDQ